MHLRLGRQSGGAVVCWPVRRTVIVDLWSDSWSWLE